MPRWWVTHVVGFDSPCPRLALLLLFIHRRFLFCADVPVPVPFILHVDRLVSVVSAAVIPGSSGFFDTSGLLAFLRLPVLFSRMLLSGADGCPHTVVVLKLHSSAFFVQQLRLYFLGRDPTVWLFVLRRGFGYPPRRAVTFMRQESCGCAHTVW